MSVDVMGIICASEFSGVGQRGSRSLDGGSPGDKVADTTTVLSKTLSPNCSRCRDEGTSSHQPTTIKVERYYVNAPFTSVHR